MIMVKLMHLLAQCAHHCFHFLVPGFAAVHPATEVLLKPPAAHTASQEDVLATTNSA
jgi:hypothetical protein